MKKKHRSVRDPLTGPSRDIRRLLDAHDLLPEVTESELKLLSGQPASMRALLRRRGATLVLQLVKENWAHLLSASAVQKLFGVANSTLHRGKDADRVIAFRIPGATEFLFPAEQFSDEGVDEWARNLISIVGNGAPALQFLYVKRPSLGGRSYAETLREGKTPEAEKVIEHGITRLGDPLPDVFTRIRAMRKRLSLWPGESAKDLINEGRRI